MKTRSKLAIILGVACITLITLFGATVYFFLDQYSYGDFYKRLETRARISARYNLNPNTLDAENLMALKNQHLEKLENEREYLIEITPGTSLDTIAKKYNLPLTFLRSLTVNSVFKDKQGDLFYSGIKLQVDKKQYLVIVSAKNYYVSHHLIYLKNMLTGSVVFMILVVVSLSIYFSRHIFDPIKDITDKVKSISTENIHLRLTNKSSNNEISELILTFNDLLNRIETAFETQKNFISNASHELGTPLTAIIGEADVTLLKVRTPEEYQKSLQNILQQAERLDQITKSLLFLAQSGYKGKAINVAITRMDEIIWETKGLIDKLNPNNKIYLDLDLLPEDPKKLKVAGNRQLLLLAFANILNNACKYSNNKPVVVYIASSNSQIIITIVDEGIGIPENDLGYIYDPFFRASNTKLFEGYGIGLPLTKNIIDLHKGNLSIKSEINVGTTVQVKLPLIVFPVQV